MKKLILFCSFIILTSCLSEPKKKLENQEPTNEYKMANYENEEKSNAKAIVDIRLKIESYVKNLNNNKIRIVDSKGCNDIEKNSELYENGIYTYEFTKSDTVSGDINGDNLNDYVAFYSCYNCWNGNGAQNYLSNFIIITSENNSLKVNEDLSLTFKSILINAIKIKFGNIPYQKAQKEEIINGLKFTEIKNGVIYGTFSITTENCPSDQACYEGAFDFNFSSKQINFYLE